MPRSFLFPNLPGVSGVAVLGEDEVLAGGMLGALVMLSGHDLELVDAGLAGALYVVGPGTVSGGIVAALDVEEAMVICVNGAVFASAQATVSSVAGKTGAVSLVLGDVAGLAAALNQRISFRRDITALTGGGAGKLDGIATAAGAIPVNTVIRVNVTEGVMDFALVENEEGSVTEDSLPFFVLPDDAHPDTNNVVWISAAASLGANLNLRPLLDSTLGGTLGLWNSAHTGQISLHAHNCDAGTDGVEFTKAGIVAMLSDLAALPAVKADGTVLNAAGNLITAARQSLGVTRVASGGYVLGSNCHFAVTGITGWSGVNPNASWLPHGSWNYDRPTWRLTGQTANWRVERSATGYWEYYINAALAFRCATQWLEFPWEEASGWTTFGGYTGPPVMVAYATQLREFIPPDLLPPERVYPLVDAATITPNFAAAKLFVVTLGGNRTLANPINVTPGGYLIRVKQDATGGRTLAFGDRFRFSGGAPPVLTAAAGAEDILSIVNFGGNELYVTFNSNLTAAP